MLAHAALKAVAFGVPRFEPLSVCLLDGAVSFWALFLAICSALRGFCALNRVASGRVQCAGWSALDLVRRWL